MDTTRWRYDDFVVTRVMPGDVREMHGKIKAEKLDKLVFYDVEDFTLEYFERFVERCRGWFYVARSRGGELLGFYFMSDFESVRVARIHFCVFRACRPYLISGGRKVLDHLVPQYFDSLIGWLPEFNTGAIKYLKRLGFHIIGRVPGAVGCAHYPDCAAVMSVYTKKTEADNEKI